MVAKDAGASFWLWRPQAGVVPQVPVVLYGVQPPSSTPPHVGGSGPRKMRTRRPRVEILKMEEWKLFCEQTWLRDWEEGGMGWTGSTSSWWQAQCWAWSGVRSSTQTETALRLCWWGWTRTSAWTTALPCWSDYRLLKKQTWTGSILPPPAQTRVFIQGKIIWFGTLWLSLSCVNHQLIFKACLAA